MGWILGFLFLAALVAYGIWYGQEYGPYGRGGSSDSKGASSLGDEIYALQCDRCGFVRASGLRDESTLDWFAAMLVQDNQCSSCGAYASFKIRSSS